VQKMLHAQSLVADLLRSNILFLRMFSF